MSLYLSRLCLNPLFAPALRLAADPYELHRRFLDTVPCGPKPKPATESQPKTAELLFRVDASAAGPLVLLQTRQEPDWSALELAPRALRSPPESKPFAPELARGQRLAFRLLCQPSVRRSGRFGRKPNGKRMPGPRHACRTDEERLCWLTRKGNSTGFAFETAGLTIVEWSNSKPLRAKGGEPTETREEAKRRAFHSGVRLPAVRFDGILTVIEPDKLLDAICRGIGPGKAFGFGLLSIGPA